MTNRKKRAESFFGVHFDFHAYKDETVGTIVDEAGIARMLDAVKPDFVQIDSKGHPGISSYKTKSGTPAKSFEVETLKLWRRLTKERGIALYAHHSGVYDRCVAKMRPDWAIVNEDGRVSEDYVSVFSPYAEKILIPQLKELALEYDLDGAWIDGECWGSFIDYGTYATDAWMKKTGKKAPKRNDADYNAYRDFCRDGFKAYVKKYVTEIKKARPDFEITSNWMFSHYMPEENDVALDFMSGDYDCSNAPNSAKCVGRCIQNRNVTWDLISWGQHAIPLSWQTRNRTTKEPLQYCQEAAMVISLGGAFQFFNILYGTGGLIQNWAIPTWEKVAAFCRERQDICWKSRPVEQIAIIYPEGYNEEEACLYVPKYQDKLFGWVNALQDIQLSSQVIFEYQCTKEILEKYPVILLPSCDSYRSDTIESIKEYINGGGRVIAEGKAIGFFDKCAESLEKLLWLDGGECLGSMETLCQNLPEKDGAIYYYDNNYYDDNDRHIAASLEKQGEGKIVKLGVEIGEKYSTNISSALKKFIKNLVALTDFEPIVKVSSSYVDVTVNKKGEKLLVNLINMLGLHNARGVRTFDEIPPLYSLDVQIKYDKAPEKVMIEPMNITPEFEYKDGVINVKVEKLEIHSVIAVE